MNNSRVRIATLSLIVAASAACASSSGSPKTDVQQSSRDKVTSIEISSTPSSNAYDLVTRLRPQWLKTYGVSSIGGGSGSRTSNPVTFVYLDGSKMGEIDVLKSISSSGIKSMEWISSTRAPIVFTDIGSDAVNGVISIKTK